MTSGTPGALAAALQRDDIFFRDAKTEKNDRIDDALGHIRVARPRRHLFPPHFPTPNLAVMPGYISIKRSLQVNMVASALFTLPFFALGPFEFASLLVDGSVSAAQMGSGPAAPFLKHLLWVDAIKNCLITYWCYIAQGWTAKVQKQVIVGFVAMWASLLPLFKFANPVAGSNALPPPVIAYCAVTWTAYALALVEKPKKKRAAAKKK